MFEGLNAIPWAELSHAYGSAEEVPVWLRQLTSDDKQIRQSAMGRLGGSLEHQGGIYPATAYTVPYLITLLEECNFTHGFAEFRYHSFAENRHFFR